MVSSPLEGESGWPQRLLFTLNSQQDSKKFWKMELEIATIPHWDSQGLLHTVGFSPNVFLEPKTELRKQEGP